MVVARLPSHYATRYSYAQAASKRRPETDTAPSPPPKKAKRKQKRTRDDPANGSIYSHLSGVPDIMGTNMDILFCGINPGVQSATSGHHFAHRSNHFYPAIHLAGITPTRMSPDQDVQFPSLSPFALGLTNLAGRPTAEGSELMPSELTDGVPGLLRKIAMYKPKTVCFVGKGIAQAFLKGLQSAITDDHFATTIPNSLLQSSTTAPRSGKKRYTKGNSKDDSGYGLMPVCMPHSENPLQAADVTFFFVSPSSSARVTTHFLDDKARILASLRTLVHHLQSPTAYPEQVSVSLQLIRQK